VSSAIGLLVTSLLLQQPLTGYPPATYLNFLALGVVSQVFGHLSINFALGYLPASLVSPTLLGQPVVTALLAGPLLGETLSLWQVVGGVAVLAGVFVVHRSRTGEKAGEAN
jgi:drug/metabolite transporter (DMT)-like permease